MSQSRLTKIRHLKKSLLFSLLLCTPGASVFLGQILLFFYQKKIGEFLDSFC
jgi:hypothetical protein